MSDESPTSFEAFPAGAVTGNPCVHCGQTFDAHHVNAGVAWCPEPKWPVTVEQLAAIEMGIMAEQEEDRSGEV